MQFLLPNLHFYFQLKYMVNNQSFGQNNTGPKAGTVALPWFSFSTTIRQCFRPRHEWSKCIFWYISTRDTLLILLADSWNTRMVSGCLLLYFLRCCIKEFLPLLFLQNLWCTRNVFLHKWLDAAFRIIIIQRKLRILQEAPEIQFLVDRVIYSFFQLGTAVE